MKTITSKPLNGAVTATGATEKIFAIFDDADNSSAGFYERLIKLGIIDKKQAKPYAVAWASKRYNATPYPSRKGGELTFETDSAPYQAVKRVLSRCFENVPSDRASDKKEITVLKGDIDAMRKLIKAHKEGVKQSYIIACYKAAMSAA